MNIWTIANQKGGVGKTTTAISLAGLLADRGFKVLLIDMDPHGSLTSYLGFDQDQLDRTIYDLFTNQVLSIDQIVCKTNFLQLDLLPASIAMATLDRQLGTHDGKGLVLFKALQQVSEHYEYAIIDCPPVLGVLMVNALAACTRLLIPVQTEHLALNGLIRMLQTMSMIRSARNSPLNYTIIPTMFDRRTSACILALKELRKKYADHVWMSAIPEDTKFREASRAGVPISQVAPGTRGARAYKLLLKHLLGGEIGFYKTSTASSSDG